MMMDYLSFGDIWLRGDICFMLFIPVNGFMDVYVGKFTSFSSNKLSILMMMGCDS